VHSGFLVTVAILVAVIERKRKVNALIYTICSDRFAYRKAFLTLLFAPIIRPGSSSVTRSAHLASNEQHRAPTEFYRG